MYIPPVNKVNITKVTGLRPNLVYLINMLYKSDRLLSINYPVYSPALIAVLVFTLNTLLNTSSNLRNITIKDK